MLTTKKELPYSQPISSSIRVTELKVKKNIPTVIEYKGRRYILDMKGGKTNV